MVNENSYIVPVYTDKDGRICMQDTERTESRPEYLRDAFQRMLDDCESKGIIINYSLYYDCIRRNGFSKDIFLTICRRLKISEEDALKKYFINSQVEIEGIDR